MLFPSLNLPTFPYKCKQENEKWYIFDTVRKQYVRLTPEEWVRQHFVMYLINVKKYPPSLMVIEHAFEMNGLSVRCDIAVFDNKGKVMVVVECKAFDQPINQEVFDQAFSYNAYLKAPFLMVTNGFDHYCCRISFTYPIQPFFLKEIPSYSSLKQMTD